MKLKDGFVLREIAGSFMVVPVGKRTQEVPGVIGKRTQEVPGVIALTESGALLWKKLEQGADEKDLVAALLDEYEVSEEQAAADVASFVKKAADEGLFEE